MPRAGRQGDGPVSAALRPWGPLDGRSRRTNAGDGERGAEAETSDAVSSGAGKSWGKRLAERNDDKLEGKTKDPKSWFGMIYHMDADVTKKWQDLGICALE